MMTFVLIQKIIRRKLEIKGGQCFMQEAEWVLGVGRGRGRGQ